MARGVEVILYMSAVLEKLPKEDRVIASNIFEARSSIAVNRAYPLLHGFGIGFVLWLITIHLLFGTRAFAETSILTDAGLAIFYVTASAWILNKFHYRSKRQKLQSEYKIMMEKAEYKRVSELMKEKGKEVQRPRL